MLSPNFILLIEDTPSHAELVIRILTHYGFEIHWEKKGYDALQFVTEKKPDLFLIDISLPDITGIEVMQKLRHQLHTHIPMIAITAHSMSGTKDELLQAGFDDYLSKPFTINELIGKIKKYLSVSSE